MCNSLPENCALIKLLSACLYGEKISDFNVLSGSKIVVLRGYNENQKQGSSGTRKVEDSVVRHRGPRESTTIWLVVVYNVKSR